MTETPTQYTARPHTTKAPLKSIVLELPTNAGVTYRLVRLHSFAAAELLIAGVTSILTAGFTIEWTNDQRYTGRIPCGQRAHLGHRARQWWLAAAGLERLPGMTDDRWASILADHTTVKASILALSTCDFEDLPGANLTETPLPGTLENHTRLARAAALIAQVVLACAGSPAGSADDLMGQNARRALIHLNPYLE